MAQYEGQIEFSGMAARVGLALARATWTTVRLPILALLVILEPVVRVVLAGFALLMTLTALLFACLRPLSAFPFWGMLCVAIASVGILALYYAFVRLFSA